MKVHKVFSIFVVLALVMAGVGAFEASADSATINFETYSVGSVHLQDGWSSSGSAVSGSPGFDHAVVDATTYGYPSFGTRSLRMSNAVTSGSFGNQTFSMSLVDEAGESTSSDAYNGGYSGGTRQPYFEAQWDFASTVPGAVQEGLSVVASPDRGDGARMGWIQMADTPAGLEVNFYDYQISALSPTGDFVFTNVVSGLDRTVPHTIKIAVSFFDGPENDLVAVYVDGTLRHVGTTWEDYFRQWQPPGTRTIDSILFRTAGPAALATSGNGFLIDNFSIYSGPLKDGFVTGGGWIDSPAGAFNSPDVIDANPDDGWVFNAEPPFVTPADFSSEEASIGAGSLHVEPITNSTGNAEKFILRYVPSSTILLSDLDDFSIDFLIDDSGTKFLANQFYINLYTLTPTPVGWYDCRFDYVAMAGSTSSWTSLGFDSATTATAVGDKIGGTCPSSYGGMPAGSTVLFISVNLGDTSGNDTGVGAYFDNAQLTVSGSTTTWDFEPPSITGRANFGFIAKYKKGASFPDGSTQFVFKAGNLTFHSTSYDWLVVNQGGTNAQFKGYGTINGDGNYRFMIWAGDGSPDTFRIKIWDATTEEVVYDNGMDQPIGGGNIVVHTKK